MRFFPAVDILGGQAVRLTQGDYSQVVQFGPVHEVVDDLLGHGVDALHLVDLDAAKDPSDHRNRELIADCVAHATARGVLVQVGGGIRDLEAVGELWGLGATRVIVGTAALEPDGWIFDVDPVMRSRLVVSLDFREVDGVPVVVVDAWRRASSMGLDEAVGHFARHGFSTQLITPVARDGMASGPDIDLYRYLVGTYPIALVASGGIRDVDDLRALAELESGPGHVDGAIVGTALYRGSLTVAEGIATCNR
ncbi:MAG: HisA/HisF-related TIM barrel protein [Ferrimicrobium sp.]|uniref:1-(5-phosphoribosyl)-5-[(5-phosphoribosylamino)methylideneamino] imidazole-4-carboxamide isomerase n=1 Tax=Ferrimicrobium acidiphilum TaxID=121039 RepID=A0ABV3Y3A5_9ACTN|nr:HisA/HisF-related TIM barrel protein [Ferrimicrobium sp.]